MCAGGSRDKGALVLIWGAQVIKESLRMFPVAATGLSRCCDEDTLLGGYLLPAGTEVQARKILPCLQAAAMSRMHGPLQSAVRFS
jgi:hypothetical protein